MSDVEAASTSARPDPPRPSRPRAAGDLRRRLLRHYLPLAIATAAAMVLLMNVGFFDANRYPPPMEVMTKGISGALPGEATPMGAGMHGPGESGAPPTEQGGGDEAETPSAEQSEDEDGTPPMEHAGDPSSADQTATSTPAEGGDEAEVPPMQHGGGPSNADPTGTSPVEQSGGQTSIPPIDDDDGDPNSASQNGTPPTGQGGSQAEPPSMEMGAGESELVMRKYATTTGYVALGLMGITLLIGPGNLLLRRRTPLSSYLARDVGIAAAVFSIVHVVYGFLVKHADGILSYFVAADDRSRILTTSFGLANWTGLAAVVIVVALAAISSDAALRKLKYRRWKRIQRLNYALFPLVVMHALLYGALRRLTSPYTALLIVSVVAVCVGQAVGVRLWRQRKARSTAVA